MEDRVVHLRRVRSAERFVPVGAKMSGSPGGFDAGQWGCVHPNRMFVSRGMPPARPPGKLTSSFGQRGPLAGS
jgi:hypothetical protein